MRYKEIIEDQGGRPKGPETEEERIKRLRAKAASLGYAQYGEGPTAEEILASAKAPPVASMVMTRRNRRRLHAFLSGEDDGK